MAVVAMAGQGRQAVASACGAQRFLNATAAVRSTVAKLILQYCTVHRRTVLVLMRTVLKYSQYWSTASPQLHGPKAKPDPARKLKALRGVVATQTELLKPTTVPVLTLLASQPVLN